VLLAVALAVRLIGISATSIWHDEAMSIHTARMGLYDLVLRMSVANNQPPLFFLLLKLWAVVSWSPLWLRLLPVVLSIGGVVFAVLWLRQWDRRAGWMAGALTATSPLIAHYAQEIRAYALVYTCLLAGLYFAERLSHSHTGTGRAGLLLSACTMSYAHYAGLLAAAALWVYTGVRGTGLRRTASLAGVWAALSVPALMLGIFHAAGKVQTGFWVPPLSAERLWALVTTGTGHAWIDLWEQSGSAVYRPWLALAGRGLLTAGLAIALLVTLARRRPGVTSAVGAMWVAGVCHVILVVLVSLLLVPIALERTTFPALIPLIGVLALSCAGGGGRRLRRLGTAACLGVAVIWALTAAGQVVGSVERRPDERRLFSQMARRFESGDVAIVFPAEMQASAGFFLRGRAAARQIHCTEIPRLTGQGESLRLLAIPRIPDSAWFGRFCLAVAERRRAHPEDHGVWVVDLGVRTFNNPDRRRVLDWLSRGYVPTDRISIGDRWTLAAQRYVPARVHPVGT